MQRIILFDGPNWETMHPLTLTRPLAACRVGGLTIKEKWESLGYTCGCLTQAYLQPRFPIQHIEANLYINGGALPSSKFIESIKQLKPSHALTSETGQIVAARTPGPIHHNGWSDEIKGYPSERIEVQILEYPEDILNHAIGQMLQDYMTYQSNRGPSAAPDPSVRCRGDEIYIHPSAKLYDCILNATEGPIYIGPEVEIMENAVIRGPVWIEEKCTIHVGAKVYGGTMLGPYSKIGGEIKRTTIFGYSNKAHDGYLGDSVLGMWCNLGADTNNSNMKNTQGNVSLWDATRQSYRVTDRQFLGLIMGDHTMSAINTSFMTGSVVGVFSNIFGGTHDRWTRSFSWGDSSTAYDVEKALTVARRVLSRRSIALDNSYELMLRHIAGHR